jgi:ankyrin repeat protein
MGTIQIRFTDATLGSGNRQQIYNGYLRQGYTDLMVAIVANDTRTALKLIEEGRDLNAKNNIGMTALMLATLQTYPIMRWILSETKPTYIEETVEALIRKGALINERDAQGYTALGYAKARDHRSVIEMLERNGAIE